MPVTDIAAKAARIRASYGPEEQRALAAYADVHSALEEAGLHPYVETRGGLALCAYAPDGTLFVVASEDSLPNNRGGLTGWHLAHVPEDEPSPAWRCLVYDSAPATPGCGERGCLKVDRLAKAATRHLFSCPHTVRTA
ncbi:hypothetical protein [Streptomyces sp. YGL11-2]|uniref:hypothetical protein n=1 Tax=Streptomyces sp. YGL11-2 TaxID=3414028 RepID=UPI003CEE1588